MQLTSEDRIVGTVLTEGTILYGGYGSGYQPHRVSKVFQKTIRVGSLNTPIDRTTLRGDGYVYFRTEQEAREHWELSREWESFVSLVHLKKLPDITREEFEQVKRILKMA